MRPLILFLGYMYASNLCLEFLQACSPGSVRIVLGPSDSENTNSSTAGRVEYCYNLTHGYAWSTVCLQGWDLNAGHVACRSRSSTWEAYTIVPGSDYIVSELDHVIRVSCTGLEDNLSQCNLTLVAVRNRSCNSRETAGVICKNGNEYRYSDNATQHKRRRRSETQSEEDRDIMLWVLCSLFILLISLTIIGFCCSAIISVFCCSKTEQSPRQQQQQQPSNPEFSSGAPPSYNVADRFDKVEVEELERPPPYNIDPTVPSVPSAPNVPYLPSGPPVEPGHPTPNQDPVYPPPAVHPPPGVHPLDNAV